MIREGVTGDLGLCFHHQVIAYKEEFGFADAFEAYFARGLPLFLENFDRELDRLWVAEVGTGPCGWIAIHHSDDRPGWARLRWFFVLKGGRRQGLGRALLRTAIDFCRHRGYDGIFLTTASNLHGARRLYERAGFRLIDETSDCPWSDSVQEQLWEMDLPSQA